jgi:hypothetical protein
MDAQSAKQVQYKIYSNTRSSESNTPLAATFEVKKPEAQEEEVD